MKSEDKKMMKDIMNHKDLERNLPCYGKNYANAVYQYSLIHMILNYYTLKEVEDESNGISMDATLDQIMDEVHTFVYETMMAEEMQENLEVVISRLHDIRKELTAKMTILTAYTDALSLFEYILNRIEYKITGETYEVEETSLAARVFRYLFQDNDKMVINSKIQLVTSQLPVRMTKNRFFDYLTDTLNIYNGSEKSSLDDFIERLKSTVLLETPEGYGTEYKEIAKLIQTLSETDLKSLDLQSYQAVMEGFSITTNHLTELVSNYLLVMELINDFYTVLLTLTYEDLDTKEENACRKMLAGIHDAFVSGGEIPESVNDGFLLIEGVQEELGEDIVRFEAMLTDILEIHQDTIEAIMLEPMFRSLSLTTKLMSNSLFIDLEEEEASGELADADYILAKRDELVGMISEFFQSHTKEMNRAVMASLFSSMPVLFNSQEEIKQYIEYSLGHCNNESELMACAKILDDLMAEE